MTGADRRDGPDQHRARRLWRALEPVHAVTYFAPESQQACEALGTTGYWAGYFALRAAPLGAVPAAVVTALFHTFHPGLVARAVPAVWDLAEPAAFVDVRLDAVDRALHRLLGPELLAARRTADAAAIARDAALSAPVDARVLAAANRALPWPDAPHLVLWHAQTVLREQRGDGHVAALLVAGLDPVEALVLFAADRGLDPAWLCTRRGWSPPERAAAERRLAERGLLDAGTSVAAPTPAGTALLDQVEARTDALADAPWAALGDATAERVVELVAPLVDAIVAADGILAVNPMGLRPLAVPTGVPAAAD